MNGIQIAAFIGYLLVVLLVFVACISFVYTVDRIRVMKDKSVSSLKRDTAQSDAGAALVTGMGFLFAAAVLAFCIGKLTGY